MIVEKTSLFVALRAVPDGFAIGPAREMLGQPFRNDHERLPSGGKAVGPFHIVACHKSATPSQVRRVLGIDDATIVPAEFGVYVADEIAGTQLAFLTNCRDRVTTHAHAQRFAGWLRSTAAPFVIQRATVRRRICEALRRSSPS